MKGILAAILLCLAAPASHALDKRTEDFVAANLIAIYYHELGHALIDILKLPIFGQEEDAADVLSAVLIHHLFKEPSAQRIARAAAIGFLGERSIAEAQRVRVSYWDVHGPDLQRYYTFVCLIFGANPAERSALARELRLPEERRQTCEEEYRLAADSWGPVITDLRDAGAGRTIRFLANYRVSTAGQLTIDVIRAEVEAMNKELSLPKRLLVRVEPCDTVNAFYDPKRREIIICTEFAEYLAEVAPR
ncbi:hypothetical protein AIOL_003218 [Candidatus Rhodobacter oscarellae]|uniref:Metallopeptidase n=1 Tax=Candidatus Rhodobacter oscarellae TaxID=1675527 RepID=A0A0J9E6E0_9RHOB|nr:DUF4344 domain-containing metallopeptidase [Candidatus Rhodobacter lobularis]KMW58247.1 hypothetical protein AIOL_003218 [Candidatus Rhodobacter lobularis]